MTQLADMFMFGDKQKPPKCKGYAVDTPNGWDFDCRYDTTLDCDECKYGAGRKDPEAKCNKL